MATMRFYSRFINIIRKLVKFRFVSLLCTTYKTDHSAVTTTRERDGRGSRGRVSLCRGRQSRKGKEAKDTTFQRLPRAVSFHPFLSAQERMPPEGMHYHKQQYCFFVRFIRHWRRKANVPHAVVQSIVTECTTILLRLHPQGVRRIRRASSRQRLRSHDHYVVSQ